MFFVLSKVLGLVFEPVNFLVILGLAGLLLSRTRYRRSGTLIGVGAGLVFALICFAPVGNLLVRPLEDRFPLPPADFPAPTGIVVLGGALEENISVARGVPSLTDAAERLTRGVALSIRYPQARLVYTGGSAHLVLPGTDEAGVVHALWHDLGVPESRMTFENKSRNTYENATMTKALVHPGPGETWLLVTSAAHMPRSMGIFRQVGWPVVAYPVDYRTYGNDHDLQPSGDAIENLRNVEIGLHEWIGLAVYRLTRKTNALFPGP